MHKDHGWASPPLLGRVAWITGSSRGIGAAIARLFAACGAKVSLHGRDSAALSTVRADIEKHGGQAIDVAGDVTRFAEVEAARARIENELGPIDILVANAGGNASLGPLEETSEEAWRSSVDGNLTGTFLTLKSVVPGMKARESGCIITMSSAAAHRPSAMSPIAYSAAKAGVEIMTRHLAAQVGPYNIRVNCISPETILTEKNQQRISDAVKAQLVESHPIRRLGTPDDVARAALFLASDDAAWITGVVLDVAGGSVTR
jgi:3-oxoacyl-[acyl-carrier protein] reductase